MIHEKEIDNGQDSVKILQKGEDGIKETSQSRKSDVVASAEKSVHILCREAFTDEKEHWNYKTES